MQQPFSILQLRIHLQALYAEAITFSKLVEILNQTAADPTRHRWVSFSEQQPEDGENIILQYKTHEFESKKYDASVADFYPENCLRWLNQKGKAAAECNEIPDSQLTTSILNRLPGRTLKEKAQMLEQCFLPDGQPNYEGAILINCLRLLSSEQQGRLIENLIARGAENPNTSQRRNGHLVLQSGNDAESKEAPTQVT